MRVKEADSAPPSPSLLLTKPALKYKQRHFCWSLVPQGTKNTIIATVLLIGIFALSGCGEQMASKAVKEAVDKYASKLENHVNEDNLEKDLAAASIAAECKELTERGTSNIPNKSDINGVVDRTFDEANNQGLIPSDYNSSTIKQSAKNQAIDKLNSGAQGLCAEQGGPLDNPIKFK